MFHRGILLLFAGLLFGCSMLASAKPPTPAADPAKQAPPYLDANDGITDPPLTLDFSSVERAPLPVPGPFASHVVGIHTEVWETLPKSVTSLNKAFTRGITLRVYRFSSRADPTVYATAPALSPYSGTFDWDATPEVGDKSFESEHSICWVSKNRLFYLGFTFYYNHSYMLANAQRALAAVQRRIQEGDDELEQDDDSEQNQDHKNKSEHPNENSVGI